jgi:hypothetical protein
MQLLKPFTFDPLAVSKGGFADTDDMWRIHMSALFSLTSHPFLSSLPHHLSPPIPPSLSRIPSARVAEPREKKLAAACWVVCTTWGGGAPPRHRLSCRHLLRPVLVVLYRSFWPSQLCLAVSLPQLHSPCSARLASLAQDPFADSRALPPSGKLDSPVVALGLPQAFAGGQARFASGRTLPPSSMLDVRVSELNLLDAELDLWENLICGGPRDRHISFSIFIPCKPATTGSSETKRRRRKRGRGEGI